MFYRTLLDQGIKNIEHIYDYRKKEFYNFNQLIELYRIPSNDFLKYNQLVSSIPKEWKIRLKTENIIYLEDQSIFDKVLKSEHVNKLLYVYQLKKENLPEIKQHKKWEIDINKNEIDWKNIYKILLHQR